MLEKRCNASVIIPNYNGADTIEKCLQAALASNYDDFEVIVVDDKSEDCSVDLIKKYACRLIQLDKHSGASNARNIGALNSTGDILFFTDADCLLEKNTLKEAMNAILGNGKKKIIGGTYTKIPFDTRFFSLFQSIFINYSETKKLENPDYLATHALAIKKEHFFESNGFREDFMPILEDVEFCHRMRQRGFRLYMNSQIRVTHIFNYSFLKSVGNGIKKSSFWTLYSIRNKDLLSDSGTASLELKLNVISFFTVLFLLISGILLQKPLLILPAGIIFCLNLVISRKLFQAFYSARGLIFALQAILYYTGIYAFVVGYGAFKGLMMHIFGKYV